MEDITPGGVEVAGRGHEADGGPGKVGTVDGLLGWDTPVDAGRFDRRIHPGRFSDEFFIDPGDPFHVVKRILLDPFLKASQP